MVQIRTQTFWQSITHFALIVFETTCAAIIILSIVLNSLDNSELSQIMLWISVPFLILLLLLHVLAYFTYTPKKIQPYKPDEAELMRLRGASAFSSYRDRGDTEVAQASARTEGPTLGRTAEEKQKKWDIPIIASSTTFFEGDTREKICEICKLPLSNLSGRKVQCNNCKSFFHEKHLRQWLKGHSSCPVCSCVLVR